MTITSTALPATLSGEQVSHCIPYTGGSGGPYLLDVIDGALPAGVGLDSQTVCMTGRALVDGTFDFTLRLTDTGSDPFTVSIKSFHWVIGIGSLVFATDATLPSMVFNQFQSIPLVVAGGIPPYACEVVDDPSNPIDEPAPIGLIIPTDSCTFVGAPVGIKPGLPPFIYKVSVRAHDHADNPAYPTPATVIKEFTITVLIPPVVITTVAVGNGKCGTSYSDQIAVVDGIPPFKFTVTDTTGSNVILRGPAPSLNPVAKGLPGSAYAADATVGPYPGKFPEGIVMGDGTGIMSGKPRRAGAFPSWTFHVQSTSLPLLASQNAWKTYGFTMADANPPAVALDSSVLLPGNTFSTASNFLQDADAGKPYSKQFLATGGVPMDGFSDAPLASDRVSDLSETAGQLIWTSSISGVPSLATLGMTFTAGGVLRGTGAANAVGNTRMGFVTLTVTAADVQLPQPPLTAPHFASGTCQFSVGPDLAIITESTAAATIQQVEGNFAPINTFNHVSYEYNDQSVYVFEPSSTLSVRGLATTDLTATHAALPAAMTAAGGTGLLEKLDHQPITVNPTWWAYDAYNLNAGGARALQHADPQKLNGSDGYSADSFESYGNSVYYMVYSYGASIDTKERNGDACIELPAAPSVTHDPIGTGVYNNGGQLRAFDGGTYLGFYIVRKDSKLYIPWVINKSSAGIQGFGDTVLNSTRTVSSVFRRLQITVSPDGRFAAAKLKPSVNNFAETCGGEQIVIFSLTGEKVFTGTTSRTMTTGGAGNTNDGQFFYGDSMALTNDNLYFLKGNNIGTSSDTVIYSAHWVYKVDILSGAPALLASGFGGTGVWTNASTQPLSTTFHRWAPPGCTGLNPPTNNWVPSPGAAPTNYLTTGNPTYMAADVMSGNWGNFTELSSAPMPFRVSKNGKAIAIVAADGTNAATRADTPGNANFLSRSIYVDFQGGSFREAAVGRRRFAGGTRLSGAHMGEYINKLYNWYEGPATQLEISDDGTVIAAVYNASTVAWANSGPQANYSGVRENLSLLRATGATATDPWTSTAEAIATTNFTNNIWRFGCLALTRNTTSNNAGSAGAVIFWGGASLYSPTSISTSYLMTHLLSGTLYQYTISSGTTESILGSGDGGHGSGVFGITARSPNSTVPSSWGNQIGSIMPAGYFISNDGRFLYMESVSPLVNSTAASGSPVSGADSTGGRLVAVPVFDTSSTINSKSPLRAFALGGWPIDPVSHGFGGQGAGTSNYYPAALFSWCGGAGNRKPQVAVTSPNGSGTVFFTGYLQNNAWSSTQDYSSGGWYGGGPTNNLAWSDGSHIAGEVYAFNSNVGGAVVNLTNFGGTANSTMRSITYMQPNNTGTKVALQTTVSNTTSFAHRLSNSETIYAVTNVNFSATGALATVPTRLTIEGSTGRAGPSMTWDSTDTRLYYAFIAGGANENSMQLREASLNSAGTIVTGYRTQPSGFAGSAARFAVLNSAR